MAVEERKMESTAKEARGKEESGGEEGRKFSDTVISWLETNEG